MNGHSESVLLRRNGRLAACVPCRARKVACDHSRPVCSRCRKRKQASRCQYPGPSHSAPSSSTTPLRDAVSLSDPAADRARCVGDEPLLTGSPTTSTTSRPPRQPGYLGYTSYSRVFEEATSRLSLLAGPGTQDIQRNQEVAQTHPDISFPSLPLPLRDTCLLVLRTLPGQANERIVFPDQPPSTSPKGWAHITVDRIIRSLRDDYGDMLAAGDAGLETMAEILCRNTARQFQDHYSDSQLWLGQLYGPNLRWESLGLLWAHLLGISDVVDAFVGRSIEWVDGKGSMETGLVCLDYCVEISRHFTEANDVLLDLSRRRSTLDSMIHGDGRISCLASHGFTVTLLMYLGLHALENVDSYVPSLCSENKRRLVAQVFNSDKLGVAFAGRPPLISRRYYSTPLPLDISDEDLASDEATLMRAYHSLDHCGWNTHGGLYSATVIRARCMIAVIRDELMEISLSKQVTVSVDHLEGIKAHQAETVSGFPESLDYHPDNLTDPNLDTRKLYLRMVIHLEILLNIFFTERLLLRLGHVDEGNLLVTSFEMVTLTLKLWTNKDRFSYHTMLRNFDWLLMAHGAPGGGILCQELLYPTFAGTHPKNPNLTRSSIVQQLSLLVGFLDWIHESAPNGDICADCKAVIQRVLDHHLNAPAQGADILSTMGLGVMAQPDFNFELLDTFDWLRTDAN